MAQPDLPGYPLRSGTRISDDQRKILKDTTGFEGYLAYLEDYRKKHSDYELLLNHWRFCENRPPRTPYDCEIFDLIKDENSLISFDICCRTISNSQLFTALSEPRKGVYGRIMIWRTPKGHLNDPNFLEDLGLVLKIRPTFLKSLYAKSSNYDLRDLRLTHIPVFVASHVMVGDRVATMTRCCISEKSSAVPIVFIADATDPTLDPRRVDPKWFGPRRFDPRTVDPIYQQPNSLRRSGTSLYGEMIMGIIERNSVFSQSADALILPALLAAMHVDAYDLRAWCDYTGPNGTHYGYTDYGNWDSLVTMSDDCNELRRRIVEFEDVAQDALTGFSSLYGADWSQKYKCESTVEYFTETINRARRFEAYVRDQYQAKIGQLSLEDSRGSIELSTSQVEEGKRVKIFTVLAFVYVPLNLASSIFGMNIQQLNNSGQSIKTFLVTTVVILLLTGGSWLCTEQVNQYRSWSRRPIKHPHPSGPSSPRPTYNITVRVQMLVWLYCNGHWAWVRKSKAWWYILANSRADSYHGFGSRLDYCVSYLDRDLSAGDYVSKYMCSIDASDAFIVILGEQDEV